eukprot:TRINITY_DN72698_c0_g1_i1.p1 TRINITY_DN72698_c0_g1~~TRINITY_DN72698_c0_g1_i1.p1  ORF type:complete len:308 (+),score=26.67 TRINITY_DN72698_c0_g1_i1:157-1080(+)
MAKAKSLQPKYIGISVSVVERLLQLHWGWLLVIGLIEISAANIVFALLFISLEECYNIEELTFKEAFALSVHTFTTVGFGSVYPTCMYGNVLVAVENYTSMLVTAFYVGLITGKILACPTKVADFSEVALITDIDGVPHFAMRLVKNAKHSILDAKIRAVAVVVWTENESIRKDFAPLTLRILGGAQPSTSDLSIPELTTEELLHEIDHDSPLRSKRGQLDGVKCIKIYASFFDTAHNQEVRQVQTYDANDIIYGARFKDMVEIDSCGKPLVRNTQLNEYAEESLRDRSLVKVVGGSFSASASRGLP